MAFYVLMCR